MMYKRYLLFNRHLLAINDFFKKKIEGKYKGDADNEVRG